MTAPLINLIDGKPMDVEGWKFIGSKAESMSSYVRSMRKHQQAVGVDYAAETRVWGYGAHVLRGPLARDERYPATVGYVGEHDPGWRWDRIIWTNVEPYHNTGRIFRGREELEG